MSIAIKLAGMERIAAAARGAFAELEHWLYSHTSAANRLHVIEVEQERRGREVLRLMLQAHIDSRGDGDVGDELVVLPEGSQQEIAYRHKRLRARRLITLFGGVSITRMEYSSPGQSNLYPLDAPLGYPFVPTAMKSSGVWSKRRSKGPLTRRPKRSPMRRE
jgi:hypothetical protein